MAKQLNLFKTVFACPECGATSEEVTFEVVETMPVYWKIKPYIDDRGQVKFNYVQNSDGVPDWERGEIDDLEPYIRCPHCRHEFYPADFEVLNKA